MMKRSVGMTSKMRMEEIWKPIDGYESYLVSSFGRIYSKKSNRLLKPSKANNGYIGIELFNKNGSKRLSVHRIVAKAFIPNPLELPQINHKDENKENNNVSNLEWCTSKYNMNYGKMGEIRHTLIDYSTEKRKKASRENGLKRRLPVLQYSKDGILIARYDSAVDANRKTNINASHIGECCRGQRYKTVGGYIWKFERSVDLLAKQ